MAPYQVVEQAVVVHQEALSGTQNITQLALFNEDGTPFSSATGPAGTGVPSGGSTSQVLAKTSATDFDTSWSTLSATAVSTVPATTGLDPASTDVEKALTELAARPSGGGGLWEVVSTQTLEAASPAISFTGLADFKEVEIRWSGRATTGSGQVAFLQIQFNADSSPTYHRSIFYRQSSFVSLNESDRTSGWGGIISGSQANTNRRSFGTIYVPCDQPSTDHKTAYGDFSCLPSTSTQVAVGSAAVGWANTSDAITSLTLLPSDGQFQVGCEFELLGRR